MTASSTTTHYTMHLPPIHTSITPPPEDVIALHPKLEGCHSFQSSAPEFTPASETETTSPTTGSSKRQRQRRRPWMYQLKNNAQQQQQQLPITNPVFSPRPYESLYAERAYLSTSLQIQSDQAINLMEQYSAVEAKVQWLGGGKERRRLRKQLDLLRHRINYTVEQEKIILMRLGELYVEIQSRESWAQASYRRASSISSSALNSPMTCGGISSMSRNLPPLMTSFNGGPVELFQSRYAGDYIASTESSMGYQDSVRFASDLETVDEVGEYYSCGVDSGSESLDISLATPAISASSIIDEDIECKIETDQVEADDFEEVCFVAIKKRRLSLPCLPTVWPEI